MGGNCGKEKYTRGYGGDCPLLIPVIPSAAERLAEASCGVEGPCVAWQSAQVFRYREGRCEKLPRHLEPPTAEHQVFRLRMRIAKRSSCCAQDDRGLDGTT